MLHTTPSGWYAVAELADLAEGAPRQVHVGDEPVMVVRRGTDVFALADRCTHLAAPLSGGDVTVEKGRACITCPLHGSVFDLGDGHVVHGPAVAPQPLFDAHLRAGGVQVRVRELPGASAAPPVAGVIADAA